MDKVYTEVQSSGMVETMYAEDDGTLHVDYKADAQPAFETIQRARQHGDVWARGMKDHARMVHAFHIPVGVIMELQGIGINVYQAPAKDIIAGLHKLNRYEPCKLTDKKVL